MSPNQKAATFIGWKPDEPMVRYSIAIGRLQSYDMKAGCWEAPDMSEPNNYMEALKHVNHWYASKTEQWHLIHHGHNIWRVTAMEALAALYDALHPEAEPHP